MIHWIAFILTYINHLYVDFDTEYRGKTVIKNPSWGKVTENRNIFTLSRVALDRPLKGVVVWRPLVWVVLELVAGQLALGHLTSHPRALKREVGKMGPARCRR